MRERVSILIPTHNRSAMLGRTLASLEQITIPREDMELIVVANACTDDTVEMVEQRAAHLGFPVTCLEEPRANVNLARNVGVQASSGTIIAMLDDDVRVEPGWVVGLLEAYESHPADLVAGKVDLWWDTTRKPGWFTKQLEAMLSCKDHGQEVIELFKGSDAIGANLSWRRGLVDAIGEFIPGLDRTGNVLLGGGETEFVQRALAKGFRMFYAPRSVVKHHVGPERVTADYLCDLQFHQAISLAYIAPSSTKWHVAGRILSGLRQCSTHLASELWYRLRGDRGKWVYHRARKSVGMGKVVGSFQRLIGRTAVERFEARVRPRS
ncbi:MAG TPA: glycosyltransferase [Planctomycetota bacterium]|nr:glycosyltransferase [Planctomycetota bacterium]